MLSFMDTYYGYNRINMDHVDAANMVFMSNHDSYYYNVMLFRLKSTPSTYQRIMDAVFSKHVGINLEVYIGEIIIKTSEGKSHTIDLKDILESVRN